MAGARRIRYVHIEMPSDSASRGVETSIAAPARALFEGFLRSAARSPSRPALEVEDQVVSYDALSTKARALAATLVEHAAAGEAPFTAVFAQRSVTAFSGILAALLRGHAYVPLNPDYPAGRTNAMVARSRCRSIVADARNASALDGVLGAVSRPLVVVFPEEHDVEGLARRWPAHTVLGADDLVSPNRWHPVPVAPDAPAYLLFTSGSTGSPKGVLVSHANVTALVDAAVERFEVGEEDRFSQTFDTTFDLSAFDMFVTWERGASLVCPSAKTLLNPARFIRESQLTVWFSVPSAAVFMKKLGALKPDAFPSLRWSLFCGEALPVDIAHSWANAAPNSTLENLYGPTEATIFCTAYRWDSQRSPAECESGLVPIGWALPRMSALVVDSALQEVAPGEEGELIVTGPQVAGGYLDDPEKTAAAFVQLGDAPELYYRTGDRVRRPVDGAPIAFLGRLDHQVKILGHRVELGEVEAALRVSANAQSAVALGWPKTSSGVAGIVAFVQGTTMDGDAIRAAVAELLPDYMVPREVRVLEELPLSANGKINRSALLQTLEESA
jgi:amino acid adenylation domain-containing protein